jgi:hypothetical protein
MTELTSYERRVQEFYNSALPCQEQISIPGHGRVASYSAHMEDAGLRSRSRDLYDGMRCWSTVQHDETPAWASYQGPEQQMLRRGEEALADARRAGVFPHRAVTDREPA